MQVHRSGIYVLLAAYLVLGGIYSVVTPLMEASDELWHYPMVKYLSDHRALPVQEVGIETAWRQEGSQPPLYYALCALLTAGIDTSDLDQVRRLNPHADNGKITEDGNTNLIVHAPDAAVGGWHGTRLAVQMIRLLSVLMGAGTVYLGYRVMLEIWPERPVLALSAAALTAFNPMFLFISGAVNNDNLAMLLCALGIWLLVRLVKRAGCSAPESADDRASVQSWWWDVTLLGIVLGSAVLTKTSAMGLLPLTALAISYVAWKRRSWQRFVSGGAVTAGSVALIAGWWFVRNAMLYDGDWLGLERFVLVLGYRVPPATLGQLWSERAGFMMAYWGLFGGVNVPMPGWVYAVLNGALILSAIGLLIGAVRLIWGAVREARTAGSLRSLAANSGPRSVQVLLLGLWPLVVFVSWAGWATRTWSSQGRLVFSAITAWSGWMAVGLGQLRLPHVRRLSHVRVGGQIRRGGGGQGGEAGLGMILAGALAVLLLGVSAWAPFGVIAPAYRAPVLAAGEAIAPQHALQADVGGQVRLLGYDVEGTDDDGWLRVEPGEAVRVSLYWEAQATMERDWSIFTHLLDADLELVLATRDRYPGQGLLATSEMTPGQRWVDRYTIWLDETTFAPSRAVIEVGLYDLTTGERPPIQVEQAPFAADESHSRSGWSQAEVVDNALRFQPLEIVARPGSLPNPLSYRMENKMSLVGWDVEPRVVVAGETLQLTLYWEGLARMASDYQVSTQVVRADQRKAAQMDAAPANVPTSQWIKGARMVDRRELEIDANAPPGGYDILVSVYGWEGPDGIRRLRLVDGQGYVLPSDSLTLGQVRLVR